MHILAHTRLTNPDDETTTLCHDHADVYEAVILMIIRTTYVGPGFRRIITGSRWWEIGKR